MSWMEANYRSSRFHVNVINTGGFWLPYKMSTTIGTCGMLLCWFFCVYLVELIEDRPDKYTVVPPEL